jgi:short-subunit dehydrogenase
MTILITGAAHGIGYASALALAQRGHTVIATDKKRELLETLEKEATERKLNLQYDQLDISQPADWQKAADWPVDVLMSNAAIGESGPLIEIPLDRFRHLWETNVGGMLGLMQVAAKRMIKQGEGRLIIVGSTAGRIALPMLGPYNTTKFALEAMADALRMELKQFNIHVSLIEPGKIDTGFNQRMVATKYIWLNEQSAYADDIEKMKRTDARFFAREHPVDVVVKGIVHAVESHRPRTRYITPPQVGLSIWLANVLPDSIRDWILRRI